MLSEIARPIHDPALAEGPGRGLDFRAYWKEALYELRRMLRAPGFAIPFLGLPILLYLLFAVVVAGNAAAANENVARFVFVGFAVLGVMGPGLFGFGVVVATERDQGLIRLKRALPMPPGAYLIAKIGMALAFNLIIVATLLVATPLGHLHLSLAAVLRVVFVCTLGAVPFSAMGLLLGTFASGRAAPALVNLIYLPMMHLSGLFYPLPPVLGRLAPLWPAYHLQQLLFGIVGLPAEGLIVHALVLAGLALVLTPLAILRFARAD
jgi:ABC-2 type transport system permease protein